MTTAQLAPTPIFKAFDSNGVPLAGGKLYSYAAGTSTPQATYPSESEVTPNTNPIILNSRGECQLWLDPTLPYKLNLTDSSGNQIPGYPVDNIIVGIIGPINSSIIPAITNTYTLGTPAHSWANLYLGPGGVPAYNATSNIVYYEGISTAETAVGAIPTNYSYPADPYVDPRRYGADPTGSIISTSAFQTAINVAAQGNGMVWIGENCNFLIGAVSYTATGSHYSSSLRITGSSPNGSILTQSGTASPLLTFVGNTPTITPQEFPFIIENLTIVGSAGPNDTSPGVGLQLQGVAYFHISNVFIYGFTTNLYLYSALTGVIDNRCQFRVGTYGILARSDGGGSPNNLIQIRECSFSSNTWAIDWGTGQAVTFSALDMEGNGTSTALTLASGPVAGAISGTLASAWTNASGTWPVIFSDYEGRAVTFTNGSTAISWNAGLAAGVTTSASYCTAAIALRAATSAATGYSIIEMDGVYFEANAGPDIYVEADGGKTLSIRNATAYASHVGQSYIIDQVQFLSIEDSMSPTSGSPYGTWTLNYTYGFLKNCIIYTLYDYGSSPTYFNVNSSTREQITGQLNFHVVTLTGCTTAPTSTITSYQQGTQITLIFQNSTGTSNSTGATLGITSTATGGSTSTLVDSGQTWTINQWAGAWMNNTTNGTYALVASNTGTTLTLSSLVPIANASGNTYSVGGLALPICPNIPRNVLVPLENNSANVIGTATIGVTGVVTLSYASAFTNTGTKGVEICTVVYTR